MTDTKALQSQKNELTISERFANKVLKELSSNMHLNLETSYYQKQLIQGYYLGIDKALKKAEEDRLRRNLSNKDPKYNNNLAYTWNNVDWEGLAVDIIYYARVMFFLTNALKSADFTVLAPSWAKSSRV